MYEIPAPTEVRLYLQTGETYRYKSMAAALKALGLRWLERNLGSQFCSYSHTEYFVGDFGVERRVYDKAPAIMRDKLGNTIHPADFRAMNPKPKRYRWWLRFETWNGEGPVPGTGRRGSGRHFRRMATVGLRRQAQVMEPMEPAPRAARNVRNLPNSWDDYSIAAREDRNWKRFRRTQYKTSTT